MNVYDFEKTLYAGSPILDFWVFCFKKYPEVSKYLPAQLIAVFRYLLDMDTREQFYDRFFLFLEKLPSGTVLPGQFWDKHISRIRPFYLDRKQPEDVLLWQGPDFLTKPLRGKLGIWAVFNHADQIKNGPIETLYFFSQETASLASWAKKAFYAGKQPFIPLEHYRPSPLTRWKTHFFTPQFFKFLMIGVINSINGVLFSWLFSLLLSPEPAFVSGYALSLLISYLLNSLYAFQTSVSLLRFLKFALSYVPNFIIQFLCVLMLYHLLKLPKLSAYIIAAVIGMPVTFLCLKLFAFQKKG